MSLVAGPGRGGGTDEPHSTDEPKLYTAQHVKYIQTLDTRKDEYAYWLTEHLRLNGLYWGLTALHLLNHPDALPAAQVIDFVISCVHDTGGIGAAPGHDEHMLYAVSGVQILTTLDGWDALEIKIPDGKGKIARWIADRQIGSGTFTGDIYGEPDTRFLYGALNALSLMNSLDLVDVPKAVSYIEGCANPDGGYGTSPGAESHSGQIFTCVAALAIAGRLDLVNKDRLSGWLSERQISEGPGKGGLNGRPEKKEDVCYSWDGLIKFILKCQDPQMGGIADRPGHMVDVFHTHFGITGLSLLEYPGVEEVDPVYCMPKSITKRVLGDRVLEGSRS